LKVWDGFTGQEACTLQGHRAAVLKVVVSADARRAISVDLGTTFIEWDLTTCRDLRRMETGAGLLSAAALSEDLRHAVTCSFLDSALRVWDITEIEPKAAPAPTVPAPRPAWPGLFGRDDARCDAISGNGRLAICRGAGGPGVLWNAQTGRQVKRLPVGLSAARNVVMTWDGQQAIANSVTSFEDVDVWDLESEKLLRRIRCFKRPVEHTVFSGNGLRAVCSSEQQAPAVWDLEQGRKLHPLRGCRTAAGLLLDHDGRWAVAASTDATTLTVWNLETGREHRTIRDSWTSFYRMAFSGDGRRAISVGVFQDVVKVWDVESGEQLHTLRGHTREVKGVAISADGRRAVSASSDHTLMVWNLDSALCVATFTADGPLGRCRQAFGQWSHGGSVPR
jgi:WD40 repeat protein